MKTREKGQQILIDDLEEILGEAKAGEFGDFTSDKYDAPKMALMASLEKMMNNVMNGKYD